MGTHRFANRLGGLTPDELRRLRRAWVEEPDVPAYALATRFRVPHATLKRYCKDLSRPKRASVDQLLRGVVAALNNV